MSFFWVYGGMNPSAEKKPKSPENPLEPFAVNAIYLPRAAIHLRNECLFFLVHGE